MERKKNVSHYELWVHVEIVAHIVTLSEKGKSTSRHIFPFSKNANANLNVCVCFQLNLRKKREKRAFKKEFQLFMRFIDID